MATKSAASIDPMGKTSCARCDDTIQAGEYRVVVMVAEMKPPDFEESYVPGRGFSEAKSFCDTCVAEMPVF